MTRELGATSRALVAAARDGLAPDAATAARVRARIAAATSPAGSAGLAWKLAAACGVVAAIVATRVIVYRSDVPAPTWSAPAASADEIEVRPVVHVAHAETVPAQRVHGVEHKLAVVVEAPSAEPPSLAREVELVDRAMLALRNSDIDGALATIATFERETAGRGQLAEDATAIAIEAHCRRGDAVTDTLAAFDARWPSSAQRARLTAACRR